MSVWGTSPIENDDAADWLTDLEEDPSLDVLQETISEIVDSADTGDFDITECCNAVAAAEVLAELFGKPGKELLLEDASSVKLKGELNRMTVGNQEKLLTRAGAAVDYVLTDEEKSELRQVWEEDELDLDAWSVKMKALKSRLLEIRSRLQT